MQVEFFESVDSLNVLALFDEGLLFFLFVNGGLDLVFHAVLVYLNIFYKTKN